MKTPIGFLWRPTDRPGADDMRGGYSTMAISRAKINTLVIRDSDVRWDAGP